MALDRLAAGTQQSALRMKNENGPSGGRALVFIAGGVLILSYALTGDLTVGTFLAFAFIVWVASLFF